jgi:hypothetical protein
MRQLLFTDHPLHIAVGSIAPQNGFGAGGAYVGHYTPNELWRTSWDADAIATDNGSWRAGFYYKAIHTPIEKIKVITTTSGPAPKTNLRASLTRLQSLPRSPSRSTSCSSTASGLARSRPTLQSLA